MNRSKSAVARFSQGWIWRLVLTACLFGAVVGLASTCPAQTTGTTTGTSTTGTTGTTATSGTTTATTGTTGTTATTGATTTTGITATTGTTTATTGTTAGTWSIISLPQQPGEVIDPRALAVDTAGNLYVTDERDGGRIQERDAHGNWSVIAASGTALGQVSGSPALAVDATGNLYVADSGRIQLRGSQGAWSVIAPSGTDLGEVSYPSSLALEMQRAVPMELTRERRASPSRYK